MAFTTVALAPVLDAHDAAGCARRHRSTEAVLEAQVHHGSDSRAGEDVPEPDIQDATDAIVRIDTATVCGTDLHILDARSATNPDRPHESQTSRTTEPRTSGRERGVVGMNAMRDRAGQNPVDLDWLPLGAGSRVVPTCGRIYEYVAARRDARVPWNSNSRIAWLLTRSHHDIDVVAPPTHGRAPGWAARIAAARDHTDLDDRSSTPRRESHSRPEHEERDPRGSDHARASSVLNHRHGRM